MEDDDDDEHHTIYHVTPTMETPTMVTYLTPDALGPQARLYTTMHDNARPGCLRFKHAPSDAPITWGVDDYMSGSLSTECGAEHASVKRTMC